MQKYTLSSLQQHPCKIDYLEVQSFDMSIYLVQVVINDQAGMVYDDNDRPMRFNSAGHIREAFAAFNVEQAVMTQDSPYDEMIGNPPKRVNEVALPFSMTLPG